MTNESGEARQNKALWWVVGLLASIVVGGGAGAFSYTQTRITANEANIEEEAAINHRQNERLATTEAQYTEIIRRLGNIEYKVDKNNEEKYRGNN